MIYLTPIKGEFYGCLIYNIVLLTLVIDDFEGTFIFPFINCVSLYWSMVKFPKLLGCTEAFLKRNVYVNIGLY